MTKRKESYGVEIDTMKGLVGNALDTDYYIGLGIPKHLIGVGLFVTQFQNNGGTSKGEITAEIVRQLYEPHDEGKPERKLLTLYIEKIVTQALEEDWHLLKHGTHPCLERPNRK